MNSWRDDKVISDKFLPEIKRILGEHLIGEPPVEEDAERNTDLIVLGLEAVRIACRVRSHQYLLSFPFDFTIRTSRPKGTKTELTKIVEGWGRYFFYGFSDPVGDKLAKWFIGDLNVFRLWFLRQLCISNGKMPGLLRKNNDNSSDFIAFDYRKIQGFIFKISKEEDMNKVNL